jgi:intraflagellar transport protein 80
MLRSTLAQADSPVYSIVWAYDCDRLCYCTGSTLVIKSLASSAKQNAWKAHDGVVLKVRALASRKSLVSFGPLVQELSQ